MIHSQITKVSSRQKTRLSEYARAKKRWWRDGLKCEMGGCVNQAEKQPHHKFGRVGALLCDERGWIALCIFHHTWVHQHPTEARQLGLLAPLGQWNNPKAVT